MRYDAAAALLTELAGLGVAIRHEAGRLRVSDVSPLDGRLCAALRDLRAELIFLLEADAAALATLDEPMPTFALGPSPAAKAKKAKTQPQRARWDLFEGKGEESA